MKHLVTPRLLMRPFTESDLGDLSILLSDPEVMKYISGGIPRTPEQIQKSLDQMIQRFEDSGYGMFAVFERKEKKFIGRCGLQPLQESGLIELGYTFIPSAWGKGFATESSMEVLRSAFNEWGLGKIVAIANEANRASMRVMEKLGMMYSGKDYFYDQQVILYSIKNPHRSASSLFHDTYDQLSTLSIQSL